MFAYIIDQILYFLTHFTNALQIKSKQAVFMPKKKSEWVCLHLNKKITNSWQIQYYSITLHAVVSNTAGNFKHIRWDSLFFPTASVQPRCDSQVTILQDLRNYCRAKYTIISIHLWARSCNFKTVAVLESFQVGSWK